eukprot:847647_1
MESCTKFIATIYLLSMTVTNAHIAPTITDITMHDWTNTAIALPSADRDRMCGLNTVTQTIYILGGESRSTDWISYDINNNQFDTHALSLSVPFACMGRCYTQFNHNLYFITDRKIGKFDMNTETVNYQFHVKSPTSYGPRVCLAISEDGNHLFALGGSNTADGSSVSNEYKLFDLVQQILAYGPYMGYRRSALSCQVVGDYLYAIGGDAAVTANAGDSIEKMYIGDLAETYTAKMASQYRWDRLPFSVSPILNDGHESLVFGTDIYIIGGGDDSSPTNRILRLDTTTDILYEDKSFPVGLKRFCGVLSDQREMYVVHETKIYHTTLHLTSNPTLKPTSNPTTPKPTLNPTLITFGFKSGLNVLDKCNNCPVVVTLWYNHAIYQTSFEPKKTDTWYLSSAFTLLGLSDCLPNAGNSETKVMIDSDTSHTLKVSHIQITTASDWYGISHFRNLQGEVNANTCLANQNASCGAIGTGGISKQMFHLDMAEPSVWIESQLIDAKDIFPDEEAQTCDPTNDPDHPSSSTDQPTLIPTRDPSLIPSKPSILTPTRQREASVADDVETTKDEQSSGNEGGKGKSSSVDILLFISVGGLLCVVLCCCSVFVWYRMRNRKAIAASATERSVETQDILPTNVVYENRPAQLLCSDVEIGAVLESLTKKGSAESAMLEGMYGRSGDKNTNSMDNCMEDTTTGGTDITTGGDYTTGIALTQTQQGAIEAIDGESSDQDMYIADHVAPQDLAQWLQSKGLGHCTTHFMANGYDGLESIKSITTVEEVADIGIQDQEDQNKLVTFIRELVIHIHDTAGSNPRSYAIAQQAMNVSKMTIN